ncbi:unnamed protein product [Brassica napus]|uniref:(rape) hypothetical protein n=1 Tax=Brassica napus TaxID=3708 RepID=A0A816JE15_BRANA|nr:unnamed protein product [Brassica napus]
MSKSDYRTGAIGLLGFDRFYRFYLYRAFRPLDFYRLCYSYFRLSVYIVFYISDVIDLYYYFISAFINLLYFESGGCHTYPSNAAQNRKRALYFRLETKTKAQGFERLRSKRKQKPNRRYRSRENKLTVGSRAVNLSRTRGQTSRILTDIKNRVTGRGKTRVSRSSKRVQRVMTPTSRNQSPRTVLSWLIDNNVILPRENIQCRNQKDHTVAAANIFLDDGRSLLECQVEAYKARKKAQPPNLLKIKLRHGENDIVCSVCHYGGKLILCDGCPSAFHATCLGLEVHQFSLKPMFQTVTGYAHHVVVKPVDYLLPRILANHPSCLQDLLNTFLAEKWFCSKDCEEIFVNLRELIGKPREVCLKKNLTWRLVQSLEQDTFGTDASKIEAVAETHCKLSVALDVMHELFEPVKRRHSGGDLAEDVIFSRWSKYKRLNFSGFYTVLLERNDELIIVATVRILGKKVAEMPFIGTRFQHRQHGMCRVFMDELEKVLIDLGVERLVLPAVRCILDTWINSFGFSKVTIPEKKNFLQFTFLEFGRTILCQKILIKSSVSHPPPSTSTVSLGETNCDIITIEDNSASDGRSEIHEAEQNMRIEDISTSDDRSEVHQAEKHLEESSSTKNTPDKKMNVLHHISLSAIFFLLPLLLQQEPSSSAIILSLKKRHGSSGNQYSSSRPSSFQGNRSTCSLFMGTWVHDDSYPLYKPADCPAVVEGEFDCLMYGRPDSNYLKYRWQPQNCNLPTFNGAEFLLRMKGKNIMFAGDSLGKNQWESLICLIMSSAPSTRTQMTRGLPLSTFRFLDYGITMSFYKAPFLVDIDAVQGKRVLKLEEISGNANAWHDADLLIFNTGHWWSHTGSQQGWDLIQSGNSYYQDMDRFVAMEKALRTWAYWVETHVDRSRTQVFFLSISPTHDNPSDWAASSSSGSKNCYGETDPITGSAYPVSPYTDQLRSVIVEVLHGMHNPALLLDITLLSSLRKDGHPSVYSGLVSGSQLAKPGQSDCSHWCLPGLPDTWNQLLYTILFY